jgi:hypothetical protein
MPEPNGDSWAAWAKHVLAELERLDACGQQLKDKITHLEVENAKLQVKSGVWGAFGASVPVVIGLLMYLMTK